MGRTRILQCKCMITKFSYLHIRIPMYTFLFTCFHTCIRVSIFTYIYIFSLQACTLFIYMYIYFLHLAALVPSTLGECSHSFSFYLSHRSHYQPTSSYASRFWFSTRLKLFNLHFSSNLSILVMTINHTGLPPISVQHTKHRLWKPCSWPSWNRWGHQWRS